MDNNTYSEHHSDLLRHQFSGRGRSDNFTNATKAMNKPAPAARTNDLAPRDLPRKHEDTKENPRSRWLRAFVASWRRCGNDAFTLLVAVVVLAVHDVRAGF